MKFLPFVLCFVFSCTNGLLPALAQTNSSTQPEPMASGGIYVEGQQIVSAAAGPMVLKGVNFEGSWKYFQGQKLDEVAKTGANSVRIVWNTWQSTDNLAMIMDEAIANGLFPILEIHDATIGHQLASSIGDVAAFRQVVSWWISEDVKNVLLPLQDKMIVNIANETFRTDFGLEGFVDEYTSAITQLREAGYTTHFIIDGPDWGQDYQGGVNRLKELQNIDSNISLGVHMYFAFLADNSIDELFAYMAGSGVPWSIGEFSVQTPGCSGELDYPKIMSLANQHQIGYQAWSWGHGNSDCPAMDMTLPNGDFDDLTAWGRVVADDLANSPNYLLIPAPEPLRILGTQGPDNILLSQEGNLLEVNVNGDLTQHNLQSISRVEIFAFGGRDDIEVDAAVPAFISGGFGPDEIRGGSLENEIQGGPGPDLIYGGPLADNINAGRGQDTAYGLGGDDIITGGDAADTLFGGDGDDEIAGGLGADELDGGSGNDDILGNTGADILVGGSGDDFLSGQGGPDDISGGPDSDELIGGEGFDILDGGSGVDQASDQGEIEVSIEN